MLVYVVYSPELNAVIRYSLVYYTIIIQHVVLILLESNIGEMEFLGNGDLLHEGRMIEELELEAETIGGALRYLLVLIFTLRNGILDQELPRLLSPCWRTWIPCPSNDFDSCLRSSPQSMLKQMLLPVALSPTRHSLSFISTLTI